MSAAGAAVVYGAVAVTTAPGGVVAVLIVAAAIELVIAVGAAGAARWLPLPRALAVILALPVLLWALFLLVAVTARAPELASALATVPLTGASTLSLVAAGSAGADARRATATTSVRPRQAGAALVSAALLTALIVTPSVAAALPGPDAVTPKNAPAIVTVDDHSTHGNHP